MEPKAALMTYQLAPPSARPIDTYCNDKIVVQLLRVCRKVNFEASPLFYKKNIFSFTGRFPVSTALAFMQDRPATALILISSMELALTEDNNMRGTAEAHFPPTRRSSDCLVLQHAFHYFGDLCTLLSSSTVRLQKLYLTIESCSSYGDNQPASLSECLAWELQKSTAERPWVASWIDPLLNIESLESIKIYWISDRPRVRRMSDTLSTMQRSMLKNTQSGGHDYKHSTRGHELEFGILRSHGMNVMTTVVLNPHEEQFKWGECSCKDRSTGLEHISTYSEDGRDNARAYYRCGIAMWKEHQPSFTGYKGAYTSYCELGGVDDRQTARRRSPTCAVHLCQ